MRLNKRIKYLFLFILSISYSIEKTEYQFEIFSIPGDAITHALAGLSAPSSISLNEKNVLQIMANKNDKIGIEGEFAEMEDIQKAVKKFYQHKIGTPNQPEYIEVSRKICEDTLASLDAALAAYPDAPLYKIEQDAWSRRLDACIAFGSGFQTLPNTATVSIQLDNATKYETYMNVLDQIMQGLNSLRDSLCKEKFGVSFGKLNDKVEIDKQKISAVRQVYPKKIMKEKNRSVQ